MNRVWKGLLALYLCLFFMIPWAARADHLPENAYVGGVKGHAQKYSLSCEARSAVDWAAFFGKKVSEVEFLNKLPRSDNPETGFVGHPNAVWGAIPPYSYGVHAEPVAALLREYGLQAQAAKGLKWDDLRSEIAANRPVIVWVVGQMWKGSPVRYTTADGQTTRVANFEHTMILVGYSPATVNVIDAYSGLEQVYGLKAFLASWTTLGKMAITAAGSAANPQPEPAPLTVSPTGLPAARPAFSHTVFLSFVMKAQERNSPAAQFERYKVRRGDYLLGIAKSFGLDWRRLAELNGISYPYILHPGRVLRLR